MARGDRVLRIVWGLLATLTIVYWLIGNPLRVRARRPPPDWHNTAADRWREHRRDVGRADTAMVAITPPGGSNNAAAVAKIGGQDTTETHTFGKGGEVPPDAPTVVVVSTAWRPDGTEVLLETRALMLTMLRWEKGPLRVVIVCNDPEKRRKISGWFSLARGCDRDAPLAVDFVSWDADMVRRGAVSLGVEPSVLTPMMFLPQTLQRYNKVIVYDSAVLLNRPISELWQRFDYHVPARALFAATEYTGTIANVSYQHLTSSGLLLLRLDRMREAGWMAGHPWLAQQIVNRGNFNPKFGDQTLFNLVRHSSPSRYGVTVPSKWISSYCQRKPSGGSAGLNPRTPPGMVPAGGEDEWTALHMNCWSPIAEGTAVGRIRAFYYATANRSNIDLCAHKFV